MSNSSQFWKIHILPLYYYVCFIGKQYKIKYISHMCEIFLNIWFIEFSKEIGEEKFVKNNDVNDHDKKSDEKQWGLLFPSRAVYEIGMTVERFFRRAINANSGFPSQKTNSQLFWHPPFCASFSRHPSVKSTHFFQGWMNIFLIKNRRICVDIFIF